MALISVLIGSVFGFASFMVAMTVYKTSLLWALAIYSGTGIAIALTLIILSLVTRSLGMPIVAQANAADTVKS